MVTDKHISILNKKLSFRWQPRNAHASKHCFSPSSAIEDVLA